MLSGPPGAGKATVTRLLAAGRLASPCVHLHADDFWAGVVGPWFVDAFRRAARAAEAPLHYAVLRPDEQATPARGTARVDHPLTDPGPIRAMHAQFRALGRYERHALDTTGLAPEAAADAVLAALAAGDLCLEPRFT